jgi:mitochondrial fission protein ELM1
MRVVMNIWHLTDGKAGHVAQARGLFAALERQGITLNITEIAVANVSGIALALRWITQHRLGKLPSSLTQYTAPDLIVAAGQATHWPLILLRRLYPQARSLLLMRPSLPRQWFDLLMVPEHDEPKTDARLLVTRGVINPLINEHRHQPDRHLILLGGPSKRHGWYQTGLIEQLQGLKQHLVRKNVWLSTSRRTPTGLLGTADFVDATVDMQVCPVDQTPTGWVFEQMHLADTVWVTEDSVSMVYEALTAGCRVGVLNLPRLHEDRVTRGLDQLMARGQVLPSSLALQGRIPREPLPLNEANRAALWLLQHLADAAAGQKK